jgi:NAD(P)-dependent dehydrogenase (short-subunit alcohol dehydrogenase family)
VATNTLILGASRGIGLALVQHYLAQGARVTGSARGDEGVQRLRAAGARAIQLDIAHAAGASALAWQIDGERYDTVFLNAGVYGPRQQGLQAPTEAEFDAVMRANVFGAMQVLPQLGEHLAEGARVAVVSSQMGSIGLRRNPNGWLYRASKAALNSVLKDASLALAGQALCVAFHPGWVRTDMGGAEADISPEQSAADMARTLAALQPAHNGQFFNHDGAPLAW